MVLEVTHVTGTWDMAVAVATNRAERTGWKHSVRQSAVQPDGFVVYQIARTQRRVRRSRGRT